MKGIWIASLLVSALSAGSVFVIVITRGFCARRPILHPAASAVMEACQNAKYVKGGHKTNMGLYEDCMRPIMEGKSMPPNVSVDQTLVTECKAMRVSHHRQ